MKREEPFNKGDICNNILSIFIEKSKRKGKIQSEWNKINVTITMTLNPFLKSQTLRHPESLALQPFTSKLISCKPLDIMQILANTQRLCLADMGADSHSESSDHTHECQNTEDYLQTGGE